MKYIFLLLSIFINPLCYSQSRPAGPIVATPNAASLGLYGEVPVSYFTGLPNIEIPIYTIQERGLSFPITMSYHALGFKPDVHPSWVGANWSLNFGGAITRKMNKLPDEWNSNEYIHIYDNIFGYYYTHNRLNNFNWSSNDTLLAMGIANGNNNEQRKLQTSDREPDEFNFNFLGFSGKFYLDHLGNYDIVYNHLNLPQSITVRKTGGAVKGTITYTYDATGNKIIKLTTDNGTAGKTIITTTTYIGGIVYESKTTIPANTPNDDYTDRLQFIAQEEGRIRFKEAVGSTTAASFQYDYMLKDHLGNIRMVLTEEQQQDKYPAVTLENDTYNGGTAISIESQYYSIDNSKIVPQSVATGISTYQNNNNITNPNLYSNTGVNSARLYLLNATTNTVQNKNGLGIVLKVMAGESISIFGKSYHIMPAGSGYSSPANPLTVLELMELLAASPAAAPKGITGSQISGLPGFPTNVTSLLNNQPPQATNRPRASINWVILDEQFKYVSGGFDMVGIASNTKGTFKDHIIPTFTIPKNGYIYVYCSNESQYNVFFDNLQVVHDRGPILEETHYYPFGLTMAGISSKAAGKLENKRMFNDGTELQSKEFSDGSGLELYATDFRSYDPQIGRFIQIDEFAEEFDTWTPYAFANDNPILINDPTGLAGDTSWKKMQEVTVAGRKVKMSQPTGIINGPGSKVIKNSSYNTFENNEQPMHFSIQAWNPNTKPYNGNAEMVGAVVEVGTWLFPWGKAIRGVKAIYTLNKLRQLNKAARILQRVKVDKILHILNGSKLSNHAWDKVVSNPNDWNAVSNLIENVLDNGVGLTYGAASSKVLQISGEFVQVTYGYGADGLIRIGDAWVVTNPSIKYEALKILSATAK